MQGPDNQPRKVKVLDNGDNTYKASYVPDDVGKYKVQVKYGGQEVPKSPFTITANPTGTADKCKITGGEHDFLNVLISKVPSAMTKIMDFCRRNQGKSYYWRRILHYCQCKECRKWQCDL